MHLVLTTFGSSLKKKGERFLVKTEEKNTEVASSKIESIQIHTGAHFSSDAMYMAMQNNIPVVFFDKYGNPFSRVWHSKMGSTAKIRIKQLKLSTMPEGVEIAKEWISEKMDSRIEFLKKLASHRPEKKEKIKEYWESIEEFHTEIKNIEGVSENVRDEIMGYEGRAGRVYFDCLEWLLPERYEFKGRSKMPSKDGFNCFLNYSYGVFYSLVEKGCIIAGLEPFLGLIHADNYNKKSMVFDLIEPFRHIAEKTVFYLHSRRKVNQGHYDELPDGYTLNKSGKKLLMENLNNRLEEKVRYKNKNMKLRNTIQAKCHHIANRILRMDIPED